MKLPQLRHTNRLRRIGVWGGLCLLVLCALNWVVFPLPHEKLTRPHGTFVYSRDGHLLNCFTSPDRFWRKPVTLDEISPLLVKSVIACEDQWFYYHPGFNPISLISAAIDNARAGKSVRGGSTLTMQIARMMEPKARTIPNKLIEILRAVQLEVSYSKKELLEIYLTLAPYGGNIEGVGAASYLYFDKSPDRLSISEAAILTAIPSSPTQFRPDRDREKCLARRNVVLRLMRKRGVISDEDFAQALKEEVPERRLEPPVTAPHFCQSLVAAHRGMADLRSTLDYKLQVSCERLAHNYQASVSMQGINNLSVVVLDNKTGELLAMVGSADYGDVAHHGQINGALAPRSPGSALKPFAYALGFDKGLVTEGLKVEDVPINYAGYMPVNYDNEYHGAVPVREALIQSLNVPAVNLVAQLGLKEFFALLHRGGISTLNKKYFDYGLPLILGSGEVNLLELCGLYSTLARGGTTLPVKMLQEEQSSASERLFSQEACYLTTEILAELKRPDLPTSWEFAPELPKVAWKTGTSYGRKDAWAIGYNPDFTVGVWAGNFSAEGSIAIVGAEIAAPLMLDIFNHICTGKEKHWFTAPPGIATRSVCAASGMPAGEHCPEQVMERYIVGVSSMVPCNVHREMLVDGATGCQLCRACSQGKQIEKRVQEVWPPRMASWLMRRGIVSLTPMHNPECRGAVAGGEPVITSPEHKAVYVIRPYAPEEFQKILFEASVASDCRKVHWFLDGQLYASSAPESRVFYSPTAGKHRLLCVDSYGRSSQITFTIQ